MARTNTTEGQGLWQPGGAEEDSHFREGNRHLCLAYDDYEKEAIRAHVTPQSKDRLVGLVVKASASRAEGPGFESRLRRDFFGVESYQ